MKVYQAEAKVAGKDTLKYGLLGLDPNDEHDMAMSIGDYCTKIQEAHGMDVGEVFATIVRGVKYRLSGGVNKGRTELIPSKTSLEKAIMGAIQAAIMTGTPEGIATATKLAQINAKGEVARMEWWKADPTVVQGFISRAAVDTQVLPLKGGEPELEPLLRKWSKGETDEA